MSTKLQQLLLIAVAVSYLLNLVESHSYLLQNRLKRLESKRFAEKLLNEWEIPNLSQAPATKRAVKKDSEEFPVAEASPVRDIKEFDLIEFARVAPRPGTETEEDEIGDGLTRLMEKLAADCSDQQKTRFGTSGYSFRCKLAGSAEQQQDKQKERLGIEDYLRELIEGFENSRR